MEVVYTKNAPDAIGPYSQAIKTNGLVFTSGQIAINPATGNVEADTIEGQTEQVMQNLKNLLEASGSSLEKAVKTVLGLSMPFTESISQASLHVHAWLSKLSRRMFFAKLK